VLSFAPEDLICKRLCTNCAPKFGSDALTVSEHHSTSNTSCGHLTLFLETRVVLVTSFTEVVLNRWAEKLSTGVRCDARDLRAVAPAFAVGASRWRKNRHRNKVGAGPASWSLGSSRSVVAPSGEDTVSHHTPPMGLLASSRNQRRMGGRREFFVDPVP
jgi:hypothetical protein